MSLSSFDYISPKITLYYNGHNSHISRIGGFLSLCLSIIICIIIFYYFWYFISPKYCTSFIYTDNSNNNKISQNINYEGINHFIKIQSNLNNNLLKNINNKNILIYAIKENNNNINNNYLYSDPSNIEHWLYDNCENIYNIEENLFSQISNNVDNYKLSICLRFYYNPVNKKYYEIGNEGYIEPILETNNLNERRYSYKIIIQKCFNNTLINNILDNICNMENEINNYLDSYNQIFIYFSNNKILPLNSEKHFEKYFDSISSLLHQSSYFENNVILLPIKLNIKKGITFNQNKDIISYTFDSYYQQENLNNSENRNLLGIFNFYLNNNILTYEIFFSNILDILSNIGGTIKILYFVFQLLNYINNQYIIIENTKNLFQINSGIDSPIIPNLEIIQHLSTKNYKIRQLLTNDDGSKKAINNFSPATKKKSNYYDSRVVSPKSKLSLRKNNKTIFNANNLNNKKILISKKNSNTFNIRTNDKRKSSLSQGYHLKSKDKENSENIYNYSNYENEASYNEIASSIYNNNNNEKNSNYFNPKENIYIKIETAKKNDNEYFPYNKNKISKKRNLKFASHKYLTDKKDGKSLFLKVSNKELPIEHRHHLRHKSINYNNDHKKLLKNSTINRNYGCGLKNSSELINDSSKQIFKNNNNNNNLLLSINHNYNKRQYYKNRGVGARNSEMISNTKNLNILENNENSNLNLSTFFKSIIKNKLKLDFPENQEAVQQNIFIKKYTFVEFFKFLFTYKKTDENKLGLIYNFRLKLLSEEHLYRNNINLYLVLKLFELEESYKCDIKELYSNL